MANVPRTERFGHFVVEIEYPTGSGQFRAPVAFVKRSFKRTVQTSDTIVVDTDDPDAPAPVERNPVSTSWEIAGSGAAGADDFDFWDSLVGLSILCRITRGEIGAAGGRQYLGNGIINDISDDSDKKSEGGRTQRSVSIQSDGPLTINKLP